MEEALKERTLDALETLRAHLTFEEVLALAKRIGEIHKNLPNIYP